MKRYINPYSFLILMAAFISACKVSKDVATPKAELPANFRNAANTSDTSSIADVQWKSFFTDVTLQKLIDSAIAKNYDMQIAVKNIEASQLLFKQVKWNYVPELNLNVTANTNRPSNNSVTGLSLTQYNIGSKHIEDYNANLALTWEADIWGKIRNQSRSALASYLQTAEAKKLLQTNIVASVSQGYYNLLMLDDQLAIAQKNVRLNDSTLRIIRLQFDAGQTTLLAVQQADAQRLAAAQLVPGFEQNIAIQENAIKILTGSLPDRIERTVRLEEVAIPENLSAGVPSVVVSHRPDVKSAELALTIANANVGIAQANMYPSLTITGTGGLNTFRASNWFTIPASLFGTVAGAVAQPLFQHRQLKTQYKVALVDREKTVLQFRQSVLNAVGEVSDALVKIEKLKTQQGIIADRVSTLQKATSNANLLFRNGQATYLEVITAQSNVLQSELDLATVKNARLNAVSDLYRSVGGGWK
ncbi:TolC family protein [Mucilaginibacter lappiensis]|uniref:NodT family efflux transporter outer membrane factor (OMF) lipoprotein n=1 Tax=Mucilaginibacter lappiensis TaxID=354630 RepID=A0A841J445_9SPHI|nr:efflux transporter outer membrane subunit [Mucilaginibacter lappiensis]MBB6107970.1 NodT family efflux transporter outer membrane factor (OMF) lipoprotein [Mucilaginibacter lappiensis]MBB6125959.1 NodT family efflux transporter outer membrane factor (OMF) lipoprotein [Mucilaginibacter lappiensis]